MSNFIEVATEDNLQYQFFPVSSGSVQLKVRASNDAHIALTRSPQESDPIIEIILGGWSNSKSVFRKNKSKPDVAEVDTPDILDAAEYRSFWIRWDCGIISVGKEGEAIPFISWTDPQAFTIGHIGVCTGHGATGSWKIDDGEEVDTPDKLEYIFKPVLSGCLEFEYRGPHNCHLCLTNTPAEVDEPIYEFILGGWENTQSVIRHNKQTPAKVIAQTKDLMRSDEYKKFVLMWHHGRLSVSDKESGSVIVEWTDTEPFSITYFGVRTGWGASGNWRIKHFPNQTIDQQSG